MSLLVIRMEQNTISEQDREDSGVDWVGVSGSKGRKGEFLGILQEKRVLQVGLDTSRLRGL